MKKLYQKIMVRSIAFGLMMTTLVGCKKDFLDLSPYTSLDPAEALKTEADLRVAMNGVYNGLRGVDIFGRTIPVLGDIMAENVYQHPINSNRYTQFNLYAVAVNDGNVLGFWTQAYNTILRCNNIINSPLSGTPGITQIKGEAKAVRALLHFYLVNFFARPYTDNPAGPGVPVVTAYDINAKPGRNTVQEVYTQVLKDLGEAYNEMTTFTNSSLMHKWAARGLEAKVRLLMNDNAGALTAANDVITNSGFAVVGADSAAHVGYWTTATFRTDRLETLFEVSMDAVGNLGFDNLGNMYNQNGYGDLMLADDVRSKFSATDVRRHLYFTLSSGNRAGAVVVNKFRNLTTERDETKVLRMSDIYLIAAEAEAATNSTNALARLNFILTRRDPAATPYASTGAQLITDILNERQKEFIAEGHRFMDLNRRKLDLTRGTNFPASARTVPYTNFRRILPIPEVEGNANPTIKGQQNPGY